MITRSSRYIFSAFLLLAAHAALGGENWLVKDPFEQKVFIGNMGQYSIDGVKNEDVLFGARQDGLQYYFTRTGIWIMRYVRTRTPKNKINELLHAGAPDNKEEKEELEWTLEPAWHRMEFEGANTSAKIEAFDQVSQDYNFGQRGNSTLQAHAWKKLVYKDLYEGVDMEIYFPEDRPGFKYSFIVHPHADPRQIKITYPLSRSVRSDADGNIIVRSAFGDFTDHAPSAIDAATGAKVNCTFGTGKEHVQFIPGDHNSSNELLIDPWVSVPVFTGSNNAFDVEYDNAGNCYAYGGIFPFELVKFNSAGVLQWTYTTTFTSQYITALYGDFTVDRNSGSCYIAEAFGPSNGANIIKLNPAGMQTGQFGGNLQLLEMWRIDYSECTHQLIVAGGGTTNPSYTGCYIDTSLTSCTLVNILNAPNGLHDMCGLALDAYGNCYMSTCRSSMPSQAPFYDNIMMRLPVSTLAPAAWTVNTGYQFREVYGLTYYPMSPSQEYSNGYNGMTASNTHLYTYDSYVLKKWNTANGNQLNSMNVNGSSQNTMTYGGITADECDNVFVGRYGQVWQYNNNLVHTNTYNMGGTVYDCNLDKNNNILYACGAGFVSATNVNLQPCMAPLSDTIQFTSPTCSTLGSATVTVSGGTGNYSVTWNTNPVQTGFTATGLSAGTYIVTIADTTFCPPLILFDTVVITPAPGAVVATVLPPVNVSCSGGSNGSAAVNASGGIPPYTYAWSNGQTTAAATGLSAGTYTITVSDNAGCSDTQVITITQPSPLVITATATPVACGNNNGTATVSANGGTAPYTYLWSNGSTSATATNLSTGNYTVTVTDQHGCSDTAVVSLVNTNAPSLQAVIQQVSCSNGNDGSVSLNVSGGQGPYTYSWNPNSSQTNASATGLAAGTYTVLVTDANGCSSTAIVQVTQPLPVVVTLVNAPLQVCQGQSVTLHSSVTGGSPGYTYLWSTGASSDSINVSPPNTASFTLVVTDANGCTGTVAATVNVDPLPLVSFTANDTAACGKLCVNFSTNSPGASYSWSFGDGDYSTQQNPVHCYTLAGSYTVSLTITSAAGCSSTFSQSNLIHIYPSPSAAFSASPTVVTLPDATIYFTDHSIGATSWSWSFGDMLQGNSVQQNPVYTYQDTGSHTVLLVVQNQFGCTDTAELVIRVGEDFTFYVPNAFTPNGDPANDTFMPEGTGIDESDFEFMVFDRWGNLIWQTTTWGEGWDGRANGGKEIAQIDVYVWKIKVRARSAPVSRTYVGHVSLIK